MARLRKVAEVVDEEADTDAGGAYGGVGFCGVVPGGAGDVEVCPGVSIDVGFEEGTCGECAAGATARILEVGVVAFDLVSVAFENG